MEEDEIANKECYYKNEADNEFFNYSIHGLNIEGIKQYSLNPINNKYHHMIRLNKDLEKIMENSKLLQKERQKKYNINNRYDEERLIKIYSKKKEAKINNENDKIYKTIGNIKENTSSLKEYFEDRNKFENPLLNRMNNNNEAFKKQELKKNLLNKNIFKKTPINKMGTSFNYFGKKNLDNSFKKKHSHYLLRKFNQSKMNEKEINYPLIKPRKIVIEYHLTNDAGVEKQNKNFGHNNYMGDSFNPSNYSLVPKNRISRNIYGGLFLH